MLLFQRLYETMPRACREATQDYLRTSRYLSVALSPCSTRLRLCMSTDAYPKPNPSYSLSVTVLSNRDITVCQ